MTRGRERPVGRRPGDPEVTREAILTAARATFGEAGFDRATIRSIAARAAVDPALVLHHFGNKQELFIAAHALPLDVDEFLSSILETPQGRRGEVMTRLYLGMLAADGSPMLSLLRAATTHDDAARMLREFIEAAVLSRADDLAPGPSAALRLSAAASHLIGTVIGRTVLGVTPLAETEFEELVDLIAPSIQRYLDTPADY